MWYNGHNLQVHYGLSVSKVSGLWDFPQLKQPGTPWDDYNYTDQSTRHIDYQYGTRRINIECIVRASSWSQLDTRLAGIRNLFTHQGLRMLVLPSHSLRGYMVRPVRQATFAPARYFDNTARAAVLHLTFEEPQPFNIQFSFFYPTDKLGTLIDFTVQKSSKGLSVDSTRQRFVDVYFLENKYEVNLEQEALNISTVYPALAGVPYPVIIQGEIDSVEDIAISAEQEPIGLDAADLFLRNGDLIYVPL